MTEPSRNTVRPASSPRRAYPGSAHVSVPLRAGCVTRSSTGAGLGFAPCSPGSSASVAASSPPSRTAAASTCASRAPETAQRGARRLDRRQRLLPDGHRRRRRGARVRRRPGDDRTHDARRPRAWRGGQPRAGAAGGRAARRPLRPGPRRRPRARRRRFDPEGDGARLRLQLEPELLRYCVEKGSIALDGVSLTIAALHDDGVEHRARPVHARAHDARRARPWRRGQRRGRPAGEVRRAARLRLRVTIRRDGHHRALHRLRHRRGGDRGHPPRQVRGRRRRGRPRERGRPDDRGAVRDARGDQLHGDARRAA